MDDQNKTKSNEEIERPLPDEIAELRRRLAQLEAKEVEHALAETALRESAVRYRTLVEQANDGIALIQDGVLKYVNRRLADITGYTVEELIASPFPGYVHPDELANVVDRYQRRVAGEEVPSVYESAIMRRNGQKVDVEFNASITTYQGKPADLVIVRDITERVQAEAIRAQAERELERQNAFLENVLESIPHPFYVIDVADYTIEIANSAAGALGSEKRALTCHALTHQNDTPCAQAGYVCPLEEVKRTGEPVIVEHVHYDSVGNARCFEVHGYPVLDDQGAIVQMIEYAMDITEQKRVEAEIAQLARFPGENPNPVLRVAKDCVVLYANDASWELLNTWRCQVGQSLPDKWGGFVTNALASGLEADVEAECNGSIYSLMFVPVADEGYVNVYGRDITERSRSEAERELAEEALKEYSRRLEGMVEERTSELQERIEETEQLNRALANLLEDLQITNHNLERATLQLRQANEELESFSYSVSHDLRAPLRAIDGFARILQEEHAAELSPEADRYLGLVRGNAQQMGQLIDDLLTFSRLGRRPLEKQSVALTDLVYQVLEGLKHEHEGRQVEVTIGDLPTIQADPVLFKQVLVNLLANALKFTRRREIAEIEIGVLEAGDSAAERFGVSDSQSPICFVKDNGVGFDMRYADKLFGVFQRLHSVGEYEGTGVGLAIVQRIIHRHGGRVWAEAEVGKGATFYFTI